jgi:YVTN family beta-propeller protein
MIKSGSYVYVANAGGFSVDSTVTVIDFTTDKVIKTIHVGDVPTGMVADGNGRIWIMCKGIGFAGYPAAGDTPGSLIRISPETLTVDFTYKFASIDDHPEKLVINKQKSMLYFLYNNGIYKFNLALTNSVPEKVVSRYFYSLGYENKTGYLYASDPKDYASKGIVLRLNEDGSVVDSIQAGIVPRGFAFPE